MINVLFFLHCGSDSKIGRSCLSSLLVVRTNASNISSLPRKKESKNKNYSYILLFDPGDIPWDCFKQTKRESRCNFPFRKFVVYYY